MAAPQAVAMARSASAPETLVADLDVPDEVRRHLIASWACDAPAWSHLQAVHDLAAGRNMFYFVCTPDLLFTKRTTPRHDGEEQSAKHQAVAPQDSVSGFSHVGARLATRKVVRAAAAGHLPGQAAAPAATDKLAEASPEVEARTAPDELAEASPKAAVGAVSGELAGANPEAEDALMYVCIKLPVQDKQLIASGCPLTSPTAHTTVSYAVCWPSWPAFWRFRLLAAGILTQRTVSMRFCPASPTHRFDVDPDCEFHEIGIALREGMFATGGREFWPGPVDCHFSWFTRTAKGLEF